MLGLYRVQSLTIFLISAAILGFVFSAEYGWGIKPCEWCIYQRYPYVFLCVLNFIWLFKPLSKHVQHSINTFILAINAMLPLTHVLIEKGYVNVKCAASKIGALGSVQQGLQALMNHRSCVKVTWSCWGWSMAQWHLIFASGILIVYVWGVIYAQKRSG
ncbi:disulfide bond formation protein B [Candidatus Bodocaedibacter vickermanii]